MAQWIEQTKGSRGLIPSEGTCLCFGPYPQQGACERQPHIDVSLSPSLPLSKNKNPLKKNHGIFTQYVAIQKNKEASLDMIFKINYQGKKSKGQD